MSLKKDKIIGVVIIFILCFIFHFVYELIPSKITSIFFPVNESIWEHMKLIFTSVVVYGIIDYIILNKFKIKYNNFLTALFISAFTIIFNYLFTILS